MDREDIAPRLCEHIRSKVENRNLCGTETLLGDWDGQILLIAKDFYPASYVRERIGKTTYPYSHNPTAPTNRNLLKTLHGFQQTVASNIDCGFLYVSACFLLRDDNQKRGPLPDEMAVLKKSEPVVRFTLDNMPRLNNVMAMGGARRALQFPRLQAGLVLWRVRCHRASHPARALSDRDRFAEQAAIFSDDAG